MQTLKTLADVQGALDWRRREKLLGLVSSMGNLHGDDIALLKTCREEVDLSVLSLYVNPLLFTDHDAFAAFPRNTGNDARVAEDVGVDYLLTPGDSELFPRGPTQATRIALPPSLQERLLGRDRERLGDHALLLLKLCNLVRPDRLYVSEKHFQLFHLMRLLLRDFNLDVAIRSCPVARDPDDVALGPELEQLTADERKRAPILHQTLEDVGIALDKGARNFAGLEQTARVALRGGGFQVDYVAIRDEQTLEHPSTQTRQVRILAAAGLGLARLVDNIGVTL